MTPSKVELGRVLFWEEQLSSTRSVACGTCHINSAGGSDPRTPVEAGATHPGADGVFGTDDDVLGSPGIPATRADGKYDLDAFFGVREQSTGRKTPPSIAVGYSPEMFWDGRADGQLVDPLTGIVVLPAGASLENQVLGPPLSEVEMGHAGRDWQDVATRIATSTPLVLSPSVPASIESWIAGRSYPELFLEAFGTAEVTPVRIAMAIATYERSLVPNETRFDETLGGNNQLTALEQQGRQLFLQSGCNTCHTGNRLTNDGFFNIGVRPPQEDLGRFETTGVPQDRGRFKVPTLRNVELRAPYFHNGGMATLNDVVDFYNRGGDFNSPTKDPRIVPLGLTPAERDAIVAFPSAPLTDQRVVDESGPFERPLLNSESPRDPNLYGAGTPGQDGLVPRATMVEPGWGQNPNLTFAVDGARGGAPAWIFFDFAPSFAGIEILGFTTHLASTPQLFAIFAGALETDLETGQGFGSKVLSLDLGLVVGTSVFGQWFVLDVESPGGIFSASEAFRLPLF